MISKSIERVFITGATGFIGSALLNHLIEQKLQIKCLVHRSSLNIKSQGIETIQHDLTDFEWKHLDDNRPDVIYHFARIPGKGKKGRLQAAARNAHANNQLVQWLQNLDLPPLLVFGSGTLVYGDQKDKWVNETANTNPISFQREYFEAEKPILQALEKSGLPIMIVRPPWIYGAGSWFEWFFWKHMQEKKSVPQYGNGKNLMSLIHINDCAGLIHHISKYGEHRQIYNIKGHAPILQQQFSEQLHQLSGLPVKKYSSPRMWLQFDRASRKALTFSLKSATLHQSLVNNYQYKFPKLETGLRSILAELS